MTEEQQKELFSIAYVTAVGAVVGANPGSFEYDVDSVDMTFKSKLYSMRPAVDLQLKCSASVPEDETSFRFPLKLKNYEDLRLPSVNPKYLVLVIVPAEPLNWIQQTTGQLSMLKAGYYLSLHGMPETDNTTSVTVSIPKTNLLTPKVLRAMLESGIQQ